MAGCPACSYWGEALRWGPQHKLDSAAACCEACLDYQPDTEDGMGCNGGLHLSLAVASAYTDIYSHPSMPRHLQACIINIWYKFHNWGGRGPCNGIAPALSTDKHGSCTTRAERRHA